MIGLSTTISQKSTLQKTTPQKTTSQKTLRKLQLCKKQLCKKHFAKNNYVNNNFPKKQLSCYIPFNFNIAGAMISMAEPGFKCKLFIS
jgi:GH24 family phage-related lysozyme (muramidase)